MDGLCRKGHILRSLCYTIRESGHLLCSDRVIQISLNWPSMRPRYGMQLMIQVYGYSVILVILLVQIFQYVGAVPTYEFWFLPIQAKSVPKYSMYLELFIDADKI